MSDAPTQVQPAAAEPPKAVSVAAHPRARASIRRTRAWTAIGAFALVLFLSLSAGVPGSEATLRALAAGLVGNVAGWACALTLWRQIVLAELKVVEEARRDRARARAEAAASS